MQVQTRTAKEVSDLRKSLRTLDDHPTLIELKQRVTEQDARLAAEFASQQQRIDSIEQAFDVTRQIVNRDQRGWILAEVEYLMRLAIVRLRLMRDIQGATEALVTADRRLHDLADPAMLKIRELLAREITALKSMHVPDIYGAALRLISISDRLSLLPTAKQPHPQSSLQSTPPSAAAEQWYITAWRKLLSALGFSRVNAPVGASALRSELYYVEQLIRLELEAARQALIRLDKSDFEKRVLTARSLLDEHYNRNHEQVILLKADLTALLEANLFPDLPEISESLSALRKLQQQYQPSPDNE
jgi:uroporphyrin-3 C-methyltransferase